METVKKTIEQEALELLEDGMFAIRGDIQRGKNLLVDGKVIPCNQKLQGALTKIDNALTYIREVRNGGVAEKISSEANSESTEPSSEPTEG